MLARSARDRADRRDVPGEQAREDPRRIPDRFFDTGICESHAVAFAAGQAKAGLRPIVDIYSTFLQRSTIRFSRKSPCRTCRSSFMLDRAGLTGPDGPTHHGCFDIGYLRVPAEHGRHGPRRRLATCQPMLDFALHARRPDLAALSEGQCGDAQSPDQWSG